MSEETINHGVNQEVDVNDTQTKEIKKITSLKDFINNNEKTKIPTDVNYKHLWNKIYEI